VALLFGISIVFMAVAFVIRRPSTIVLPFVTWLVIAVLGQAGVLSEASDLGSNVLAGVVGGLFAVAGLVFGERSARQPPRA
jgi:hypothetical protein